MRRRAQTLAAITGVVIVVATTIASCSPPGAAMPVAPSGAAVAPTPEPTAAPTPALSSAPSAEPTAEATAAPAVAPAAEPTASADSTQAFVTQIGNAAFEVPDGWTVRDESGVQLGHDGRDQWMNRVVMLDDAGRALLRYVDGAVDAQGENALGWGMVEQRPIAAAIPDDSGMTTAAASWWVEDETGVHVFAAVSLVPDGEAPWGIVPAGDARLAHFAADLSLLDACRQVVDVAAAVACLASADVAELLAVLATLEQHAVPRDAMP